MVRVILFCSLVVAACTSGAEVSLELLVEDNSPMVGECVFGEIYFINQGESDIDIYSGPSYLYGELWLEIQKPGESNVMTTRNKKKMTLAPRPPIHVTAGDTLHVPVLLWAKVGQYVFDREGEYVLCGHAVVTYRESGKHMRVEVASSIVKVDVTPAGKGVDRLQPPALLDVVRPFRFSYGKHDVDSLIRAHEEYGGYYDSMVKYIMMNYRVPSLRRGDSDAIEEYRALLKRPHITEILSDSEIVQNVTAAVLAAAVARGADGNSTNVYANKYIW